MTEEKDSPFAGLAEALRKAAPVGVTMSLPKYNPAENPVHQEIERTAELLREKTRKEKVGDLLSFDFSELTDKEFQHLQRNVQAEDLRRNGPGPQTGQYL